MMHIGWVQIQVNTPGRCVMHCPAAGLNLIQSDGGGTVAQLSASEQEASSCQILQRAGSKAHSVPKPPTPMHRAVVAAGFSVTLASLRRAESRERLSEVHPKNPTNPVPWQSSQWTFLLTPSLWKRADGEQTALGMPAEDREKGGSCGCMQPSKKD